jgi:hypothetical protein
MPDDTDHLDDPDHFSDSGPVAVVWRFFEAAAAGSYAHAWQWMDPNLQTCRAQAWLWNNRDVLAAEGVGHYADLLPQLVAGPSPTRLWREFSNTEQMQLNTSWVHWFDLAERHMLGATSRTRLLYPDAELILLAETDPGGSRLYTERAEIFALLLLVRYIDGRWHIAAYDDKLPTPGWPPDFGDEPQR